MVVPAGWRPFQPDVSQQRRPSRHTAGDGILAIDGDMSVAATRFESASRRFKPGTLALLGVGAVGLWAALGGGGGG